MKDLVFVGGAKGVGKTSVLKKVLEINPQGIINTGKIYSTAKKNNANHEIAIFGFLKNHQGIVDTHYAGYSGDGFIRGFSTDYLKALNKIKSIELILIDLDIKALIERRKKDSERERIYGPEHMTQELEMNRFYFKQYCEDLLIEGNVIFNEDMDACVSRLGEFLK